MAKQRRKKQKGFQLPQDVITWIEDEELRTGANQSRIALASIFAFAGLLESERLDAMRWAIRVDQEKLPFNDALEKYHSETVERAWLLIMGRPREAEPSVVGGAADDLGIDILTTARSAVRRILNAKLRMLEESNKESAKRLLKELDKDRTLAGKHSERKHR